MFRSIFIRIVCLLSIFAGSGVLAQTSAAIEIDIPAQPVGDALNQFAEQSGLQVVLYADDAEGVETTAVAGKFDDSELVLDALLASTGLEYFFINDRTVSVSSLDDEPGGDSDSKNLGPTPILMVQNATQTQTTVSSRSDDDVAEAREDEASVPLEEIVVTGTNIQGASTGSPLTVITREEIERSGFGTIEQLFDALPQNFGGGVSLDTSASPDRRTGENRTAGSTINLRGLGAGSTLILLNGKRMAPSGEGGAFVDVSLIPLGAIERVEVLTDGASAIYGSDAIGGVVNIITQTGFEGASTSLRFGTVTDGDMDEFRVTQSLGKSWQGGNAFVSYEYFVRDRLGAADRSFSENVADADLLPSDERHSLFAAINQEISSNADVYASILYSARDSGIRNNFGFPLDRTAETDQLNVTGGLDYDINDDWSLSIGGNFSQNEFEFDVQGLAANSGRGESEIVQADISATGDLFTLPGGAVQVAVGGELRNESFLFESFLFNRVDVDLDRDIFAAYGEVSVPIVGEANARPGLRALELSAAGRFEDYSDFGSTTRPKVGIVYIPVEGLSLRGTYSESFKAPNLADLSEVTNGVLLFPAPDPASSTGSTLALDLFGNNSMLDAEDATSFTAGVDFTPEAAPGLQISATYFSVEFEDRIDVAFTNPFLPLTNPGVFGPVIARNPDVSLVSQIVDEATANGSFINLGDGLVGPLIPFDPAAVGVILDQRLLNLASTEISGLEFDALYQVASDMGDFTVGVRGDYYFEYEQTITPTADANDVLDTIYNPSDFRFRAQFAWENDGINAAAFVNYTDGYTDNLSSPEASVDAWTTVDVQLGYNFGSSDQSSILSGVALSLSVLNVFDENPPVVAPNFTSPFEFDSTNTNPLGRFIAFELSKQW